MCLITSEFAMFYDEKLGKHTGRGWKSYYFDNIYNPLNTDQHYVILPGIGDGHIKINKWMTAFGFGNMNVSWEQFNNRSFYNLESTHNFEDYIPGFHIFTNEVSARNYHAYRSRIIFKAQYSDVIGFGYNPSSFSHGDGHEPCVIAKEMYIEPAYIIDEKNNHHPFRADKFVNL